MMTLSKNEAYRLAKRAAELNAKVLRGTLSITPNGPTVNDVEVLAWLSEHADTELILIAAPIDRKKSMLSGIKTCHTCGRDYEGETCPYCANVRARLRGT